MNIDDSIIPSLILPKNVFIAVASHKKELNHPDYLSPLEAYVYKKNNVPKEKEYKETLTLNIPQEKEECDCNTLLFLIANTYKFAFWNERGNGGGDGDKWGNADVHAFQEKNESCTNLVNFLITSYGPALLKMVRDKNFAEINSNSPFFKFYTLQK